MRTFIDVPFELQEAVVAALRANAALVTALGGNAGAIRQRWGFDEELVPSMTVLDVANTVDESNVPMILQFDWYGRTLQEARTIRRLTLLAVHSDSHRTIGGLEVFSIYREGERQQDPKMGVSHLSGDLEYFPYRAYA